MEGTVTLYFRSGIYGGQSQAIISELSGQQQAILSAAMDWALAQLPAEIETVTQVIVEKKTDVVTQWSEDDPPEPLATSAVFESSITGHGPDGGTTLPVTSTPGPETDGLALLWASLEAGLNT